MFMFICIYICIFASDLKGKTGRNKFLNLNFNRPGKATKKNKNEKRIFKISKGLQ